MKVTIKNKKGLDKDLKIFVEKKIISKHIDEKYEEVKKNIVLKGFRPGKVPKEILKKQFGEAIYGEVLDKVLKETSEKAIKENNIKPAGQPKIDLNSYGEDKDLEYTISVTELPKLDIKKIENINFDEYNVKIDTKETDKRINDIAKSQKNYKETDSKTKAVKEDLVIFDYKATIDGKEFKGGEGKNTQLALGKDLFIKGFDQQLLGVKKEDEKKVEVNLPENYPEKELVNKKAIFNCKILAVKKLQETKIDDEFAKNLGAKDLNDLRSLISKQINEEYKNSLNAISNQQILEQIEKFEVKEIPNNLIEQEISFLSQGMKDEDVKKNKKEFENKAKKRIKIGLILNEFGQKNNIEISNQEIQNEIQKQLRMMPGQEKIVREYYEKNPSALTGLRGTLYEEKIIKEIKLKAKKKVKEITKSEAEKIIKEQNEKNSENKKNNIQKEATSKQIKKITAQSSKKTTKKTKKVSKK